MDRPDPPASAGSERAPSASAYGFRAHAALAGAALLVYLAGNHLNPLWDRDETRYAQAVIQMLDRGDWVVPYYLTYDGSGDPARPDPRYHKPPFVYWTQAVSCGMFGRNEFAIRLPNAVFAVVAVLLTSWLGRLLFDRASGFWGAAALASSPQFILSAKLCLCDSPLTMFTVAAVGLFARQVRYGARAGTGAAFWAVIAAGLLTKGPVLLLFVGSAIAGMFALGGAAARAAGRAALAVPWPGVGGSGGRVLAAATGPLLCAAIVAAWLIPVQLRTDGEFLEVALGRHVLSRALRPMEGHTGPPGYYAPALIAMFFPWSFLIPSTAVAARRGLRDGSADTAAGGRWAFGLLIGWAIVPWLVLEIHATKLPHYLLPAIPAAAILTGRFLATIGATDEYRNSLPGRLARRAITTTAVLIAAAALVATAAVEFEWDLPGAFLGERADAAAEKVRQAWRILRTTEPSATYWRAAIAAGLAVLGAGAVLAGRRIAHGGAGGWAAAAAFPAGLFVLLMAAASPQLPALQLSKRAAERIAAAHPEGDVILCGFSFEGAPGYDEPGMVFYLGGRARIATDRADLERLMSRPGRHIVLTDAAQWRALQRRGIPLPEPSETIEGFNYSKGRSTGAAIGEVRGR
jgi:4-amino-4-deoxy-L-arabinose transferase-like glycosyltransferase